MKLAVTSPFVDRQHGTERVVAELLDRLVRNHGVEVHLYAQKVDDLKVRLYSPGVKGPLDCVVWHRVPSLPGPHLLQYVFWYLANTFYRWRDRRFRGEKPDLLYSPGINSGAADVITVHIVFRAFQESVKGKLLLRDSPVRRWQVIIHRKLYYWLCVRLERRIYSSSGVTLSAVSPLVARQLSQYYGRSDVTITQNAVDTSYFNVASRTARRPAARSNLNISNGAYVFLLIGNDWLKKGLESAIRALATFHCSDVVFCIVGKDDQIPYVQLATELKVADSLKFLSISSDVLEFYAAADAYVGPSLEDAYGLPVLEAMACGLPVISSSAAGVSELIDHGKNGFVLRNPRDVAELAALMKNLYCDQESGHRIGNAAANTANRWTWDEHTAAVYDLLKRTLRVHQPAKLPSRAK